MTKELQLLNARVLDPVATAPIFRSKSELMLSNKRIGPKTATASLAYVPKLGSLTKGEADSVVGLAPQAPGGQQVQRPQACVRRARGRLGKLFLWPRWLHRKAIPPYAPLPRTRVAWKAHHRLNHRSHAQARRDHECSFHGERANEGLPINAGLETLVEHCSDVSVSVIYAWQDSMNFKTSAAFLSGGNTGKKTRLICVP